ncbi:hypothetical protein [Acinetobacter courvalinii]|uniref:hypothetical protein n=1 Tax=Acinetobacter courvalinii TaxID=280147 RepID=UPI003F5456AB
MKMNTQRLKRRWKWYVAYAVVFTLSFALFYAYDRAQDEQTEQMLEAASSHSISPDNTAVLIKMKSLLLIKLTSI